MNIYQKAIETFGSDHQIKVAIEELCEAAAALARYENGKCEIDEVHEELADAEIMLEQMRLCFDQRKIDAWKELKLTRLQWVLKAEEGK